MNPIRISWSHHTACWLWVLRLNVHIVRRHLSEFIIYWCDACSSEVDQWTAIHSPSECHATCFKWFFPLHNQLPDKHSAFVHPAVYISIVGGRDVNGMKASRCEISYLPHGRVVLNFNLQDEMNEAMWEHWGTGTRRDCFYWVQADKTSIRSLMRGRCSLSILSETFSTAKNNQWNCI